LLLGCYRQADAPDPERYAASLAGILAEYSVDVVIEVTHPVTGIPSHCKWVPTVYELRQSCEKLAAEHYQRDFNARHRPQAYEHMDRSNRPTGAELRAKYGPNWGISQADPVAVRETSVGSSLADGEPQQD